MIAWLVGCTPMHRVLHYEPVGFAVTPPAFDVGLGTILEIDLGTRHLRALTTAGDVPIDQLPPEVQYAVLYTEDWARSAELDLRMDFGHGGWLVQVRWTRDRACEVEWSQKEPERAPIPPIPLQQWQDRLAERFGFEGFGGAVPWAPEEVADVALALGRMNEPERTALNGVELLRGTISPRSARRELAFFDPTTEPPSLSFFDLAFANEPDGFIGSVDHPFSDGATTALHEFAHLLADVPLRRAYLAYSESFQIWSRERDSASGLLLRADAHEKYRAYRTLGRSGPVIAAWQRFRADRVGPSSYGFRDPDESFAEAFAMYHLDPDALDRALPGAVAWFESGTYLVAAGLIPPAAAASR